LQEAFAAFDVSLAIALKPSAGLKLAPSALSIAAQAMAVRSSQLAATIWTPLPASHPVQASPEPRRPADRRQ